MNPSMSAWVNVWQKSNESGTYAFSPNRSGRAMDKLDHFRQLEVKFAAGEKVLEAGCGDGAVIVALQRLFGVSGFGADFAESAQAQAERLMQDLGSRFIFSLSDIRSLPFPDGYFDKVISLGVIEHMSQPKEALAELRRVLKPGGQAIIMTPSSYSFGVLDRVVQQLLGKWHMGYQKEISPKRLGRLMDLAGLKCQKIRSVKRSALKGDTGFRKFAGFCDKLFERFFEDWGFYSYVIGTKD